MTDDARLLIATRADIAAMHRVRLAVRENRLTSSVITEADYVYALEVAGRGWVIVEGGAGSAGDAGGAVRGFAIGAAGTRNILALFVDPPPEGRRFGRRLDDAMVQWLVAQGLQRLWLSTDPRHAGAAFLRNRRLAPRRHGRTWRMGLRVARRLPSSIAPRRGTRATPAPYRGRRK